ncbi:HSF5 protein, partial [Pardalotus punctatus]|nr:HSF5 protein [Pardalotus punctatus]
SAGLNARTFPAKLWRLLNSRRVRSVHWGNLPQGLLIEHSLFERELLSPAGAQGPAPHTFRAMRFASFMCQLYLYSFHKVPGWVGMALTGDARAWLHYRNPSFRRDCLDLLLGVKRRTRAKEQWLVAGQGGFRRPPCSFHL